ncbi:hypothetical protein GF1_09640 [Desulfolithobacter dissulfuricans]|uniref:Uncharacterized protein n=1 Tax=Desulfolithobacter dissulfuricans TaxID=2795293 RepID=A0A915TZ27_9BACT|nr:hypothetical protein GF1_09640 [Desulfolithobacter dissulfuricans]
MSTGVNALQSVLDRVKKKAPLQERKISVVYRNEDGTVDYPENCNEGVIIVPRPMTEAQWELQNAVDIQKGRSSLA